MDLLQLMPIVFCAPSKSYLVAMTISLVNALKKELSLSITYNGKPTVHQNTFSAKTIQHWSVLTLQHSLNSV